MTRIVIIGGSVAGHTVASNLREKDKDCSITLITEEPFTFYDRRKLVNYLTAGIKEKELFLVSPDFYIAQNINFLKEKKVTAVNTSKRIVYFKEEEIRGTIDYDFLVICTGRKTYLPQIPGINKDAVFRLDSLHDFKQAKAHLIGDTLCFLGWNKLACEIAKAVVAKQKEVKLIMLQTPVDPLPCEGIEVINSELVDIIGESGVQAVKLKEGKIIGASLVMVFMSLPKASVDFLKDTGLETAEDGIYVDEKMCTNIENVFASGSVSVPKDFPARAKTWEETVNESKILVDNLIKVIGG